MCSPFKNKLPLPLYLYEGKGGRSNRQTFVAKDRGRMEATTARIHHQKAMPPSVAAHILGSILGSLHLARGLQKERGELEGQKWKGKAIKIVVPNE
jgi:hypothetical protein